ncbi:MAG TPA: hypothetical protein VF476_06800, partial [Chitinophagaceae bacterium]
MKKGRNILFVLMLCTAVVYSNHFDNSFHFDDSHTIVNNLSIRELAIPKFFRDGSTFSSLPANQSYRPVVTTLNAIDYSLGGNNNTFWFHLSIFASFLLAGVLLFIFLLHLLNKIPGGRFNTEIALFINGWFWLHPANAETINYIIARSDSFSTCMVLLALVMYCCWPFAKRFFLYLIPFIIGFLAKETAIMFLPLLFFYELFFGEKDVNAAVKRLIVPMLVSAGLLFLYKQMLPGSWQAGGDYTKTGYWMTQPFAVFHYVCNFFLPVNLVADTDWKIITSMSDTRFLTGTACLFLLMIVGLIFSFKPQLRLAGFGIIWFLLTLLPTSVIPLAELTNDHRTFFPYIGLFIAVASILQWIVSKKVRAFENKQIILFLQVAALVFFGWLALATWQRNKVWHSEYSLWKEVTIKAPGNGRG